MNYMYKELALYKLFLLLLLLLYLLSIGDEFNFK